MRAVAIVCVFALTIVACGGDDDAGDDEIIPTSTEGVTETTVTSTTAPEATTTTATTSTTSGDTTTTTSGATTTTAAAAAGPECSTIWSEELIQSELGESWGFVEASTDGSTCTFAAIPAVVALAFRPGGQAEFDASQSGASLTGTLAELDLCDDAFSVDVQGAIFIVEALDLDSGRIFNATVSGVDDPLDAAVTLVDAAC